MKRKHYIIAGIISVFIASLTYMLIFRFIDQEEFFSIVSKSFENKVNDLNHSKISEDNPIKMLKELLVIFLIPFFTYLIAFVLVFEIFCILYFLFTSKWKKPRIFISYKSTVKGSEFDTTQIAKKIEGLLVKKHFKIKMVPFDSKKKHDKVNFDIKKYLLKSNAIIVVPDLVDPSYVDAEVFYGFVTSMPIYLIKYSPDQKLPNTANSGHTVLLLDEIEKEEFKPLFDLVNYVHKVWANRGFIIKGPVRFINELFEDSSLKTIGIIYLAILGIYLIKYKILAFVIMAILAIGISIFSSYLTIEKIISQILFQRLVRQSRLSELSNIEKKLLYSNQELEANILACIGYLKYKPISKKKILNP